MSLNASTWSSSYSMSAGLSRATMRQNRQSVATDAIITTRHTSEGDPRRYGHLSEVQADDPQERQPQEAGLDLVSQAVPAAREARDRHRPQGVVRSMHAGFVGTGNMGRPMAANILKAGHELTVFDADPAATKPLEAQGATRAADLPSLAAAVRVTLTSLPNDTTVEAVLFGAAGGKGLLDGARPGDVVLDLSTVSPESTVRLARRAAPRGGDVTHAPR